MEIIGPVFSSEELGVKPCIHMQRNNFGKILQKSGKKFGKYIKNEKNDLQEKARVVI